MSAYIADDDFIGDGHMAAAMALKGSIDWLIGGRPFYQDMFID
jgi:hypothetical protein